MLAWRLSCIQLLVDEWNDVGNMLTQSRHISSISLDEPYPAKGYLFAEEASYKTLDQQPKIYWMEYPPKPPVSSCKQLCMTLLRK